MTTRTDNFFFAIYTLESVIALFFSPEMLALLSSLKDVKPFPNREMIKRLTFDNLFPSLVQYSRYKTS